MPTLPLPPADLKNFALGTIVQALNLGGGGGGGGAGTVIWDAGKTWDAAYAEIVAAGGSGIILVPNDAAKEMTPLPGGGNTDLSNILFVGLPDSGGTLPTIAIDSAGVTGFWLGGNNNIQSKNLFWISYYRIGDGQPATWTFDGGGFSSAVFGDAYRHTSFQFVLHNGAIVDGSSCTEGLIVGTNAGGSVIATTSARIGQRVLFCNKGVPPFPSWVVQRDSSVYLDPIAFINGIGGGTLFDQLVDQQLLLTPSAGTTLARPPAPKAGEMYFDTDLAQPVWWDAVGGQWVDATGTPA